MPSTPQNLATPSARQPRGRCTGLVVSLQWTSPASVDGESAYTAGLLDELVSDDEVRSAAIRFAERIATSAPLALVSIKATQRAGLADAVAAATVHELAEQTRLQATADF